MKHTRARMIAVMSLFLIAIGGNRAATGAAQAPDPHPMCGAKLNEKICECTNAPDEFKRDA